MQYRPGTSRWAQQAALSSARARQDPSRTRQSLLTLATFRSWGIHWMTPHEGPGTSVPDDGPGPAPRAWSHRRSRLGPGPGRRGPGSRGPGPAPPPQRDRFTSGSRSGIAGGEGGRPLELSRSGTNGIRRSFAPWDCMERTSSGPVSCPPGRLRSMRGRVRRTPGTGCPSE